jgi:hypothetical protein
MQSSALFSAILILDFFEKIFPLARNELTVAAAKPQPRPAPDAD